jgi:hypothetical protein
MVRPLGVLGLAILVLQGCAELGLDNWFAAPAEQTPPVPARKPGVAKPQGGDQAASTGQQSTAAPATGGKESKPTVEQLVGLDFAGVRTLLGAPALEEIQPPATVWAYNGRGCVLSVFFYPHVDGGNFRALTYDVKGAEQTADLPQRCFAELLQDGSRAGTN